VREFAQAVQQHLRTPLAALLDQMDLLREHHHEFPEPQQDSVAGILRAGTQLDGLVASIHDLAQVVCARPGDLRPGDVSGLGLHVSARDEAAASSGARFAPVGHQGAAHHRLQRDCEQVGVDPGPEKS